MSFLSVFWDILLLVLIVFCVSVLLPGLIWRFTFLPWLLLCSLHLLRFTSLLAMFWFKSVYPPSGPLISCLYFLPSLDSCFLFLPLSIPCFSLSGISSIQDPNQLLVVFSCVSNALIIVRFDISKINERNGNDNFEETLVFSIKRFGARVWCCLGGFVDKLKLVYFAKLHWNHFWCHKSHMINNHDQIWQNRLKMCSIQKPSWNIFVIWKRVNMEI